MTPTKFSVVRSQIQDSTNTGAAGRINSSELARQALAKFVAITSKAASAALFDIWDEALRDIPSDRLARAVERVIKTWRFPNLPTPGDVRAQIEEADEKGFELEAAQAWESALTWIRRWFHPDIGIKRGAPQLSGATEHALQAGGGMHWIERCPEEDLVWCRKAFIEDFKNVHETGQVRELLSRGEAQRILAAITTEAPRAVKLLPQSPDNSAEPDPNGARALDEAFKEIKKRQPRYVFTLSAEEIERRKREQRAKLDEKFPNLQLSMSKKTEPAVTR